MLTRSAVPGPKPKLFASCAIHAREYATAELCTRFAEELVDGYGVDPDATWILDHHEVHLMLHTNPDGRKMAETGLSWRKNTDNDYCSNTNSRGADLNRNFDFQWACCGGSSGYECDATYRGPLPASEPEIQALQAYVQSIFPDQRAPDLGAPAPADATGVAIDVHSYGELVLWSWGFTADVAPNGTALQTLGRKLAFFNGHEPDQGIGLYPTDGTSKDFYYGDLGIAGLVFELGTQFFESCAFFESNVLPGNLPSLRYAAKVARTPYLTPAGPEALAVAVPAQPFAPGDLVPLTAVLDDTRYNNTNGTEPTQTIASAEAFVDLPPWDAGAVPLAMAASDGTFDETIEGVEVTIDTAGLAPGRHILFVEGTDAAGNAGAVSAAFLDLLDPASAPVIEGTVRDADTLTPLAATVTIGPYATDTDPGTGFYQLQLPAGVYDLTATAPAYLPGTAEAVVANDYDVVQRDFNLVPESACVAVDFDDGSAAGWTNSGASTCSTGTFVVATPTEVVYSGVTTQVGGDHTTGSGNAFFSATNSSAGVNDVDGGVCIVESPVYPIDDDSDVSIWYFHGQRDQGDDSGDFFLLEISTDGGSNWTPLASYGDVTVDAVWTEATAEVTAGSNVKLRVQVADGSGPGDLVEGGVDDLWICPAAPSCTVDGDCDDGLYCNGAESCAGGACQAGSDPCPGQGCDEVADQCLAGPSAQLEWGTASVGATPVTVGLSKVYVSPVVVTSIRYANNTTPVVTRISNVTATSFDLRLQNPSGGGVATDTVDYLVVEEGVWTVDGVAVEAFTYTSTVTDENNSWVGEAQSYGQSYTTPVVLGQVMSENDAGFSVFWNQGTSRTNPPSSSALRTGKTVCEDPDTTRADETVGVVVIEAGHGTIGGVEYEAALGADSIRGIGNNPPFTYTFGTSFASAPSVAVATMAGVDGGNGGWAYSYGSTPLTASNLDLVIDEDQIGDSERNHTPEQVGYVVFATSGVYP